MNPINKRTRELVKLQPKYSIGSHPSYSASIERIIREIHKEEGIPLTDVRLVMDNIFKFTARAMATVDVENKLESIQWIYFGTFRPSIPRVKVYLQRLEDSRNLEKKEKENVNID